VNRRLALYLRPEPRAHQNHDKDQVKEKARPDHLRHRVALHQVFRGGIERDEPEQ
jgi:hypothetical protein